MKKKIIVVFLIVVVLGAAFFTYKQLFLSSPIVITEYKNLNTVVITNDKYIRVYDVRDITAREGVKNKADKSKAVKAYKLTSKQFSKIKTDIKRIQKNATRRIKSGYLEFVVYNNNGYSFTSQQEYENYFKPLYDTLNECLGYEYSAYEEHGDDPKPVYPFEVKEF